MIEASWTIARWREIFEIGGTTFALLFTGVALLIDARARRAQTDVEMTKHHRELWTRYDDSPELWGLFDIERQMDAQPLTKKELRFANYLFLHLRATYRAEKGWIYTRPERLREDLREVFSLPAPMAAWKRMKHLQDSDFIAFVEGFLR